MRWARRSSRSGCWARSACCSPTPACAMRISRCSRRAFAPRISRRSRRLTPGSLPRAVLGGMLGRGDVRRGDAFPQGGPVGASRHPARADAEPAVADAAAFRECRRLHQLPRQRRALLRRAGRERRHRRVPHLRLAQLGRQHARRHRRGARCGEGLRGRDLLHGQSVRPAQYQVRPRLLRPAREGTEGGGHAHPRHQGHGGPVPAARGTSAGEGAQRGGRPADPLPHARHAAASRPRACSPRWMRAPMPSMAPSTH